MGIVCDKSQWDRGMARDEGFRAFINKHKATTKMIENAKMIDIGAYNQLAYRTKRFYSGAERWACRPRRALANGGFAHAGRGVDRARFDGRARTVVWRGRSVRR